MLRCRPYAARSTRPDGRRVLQSRGGRSTGLWESTYLTPRKTCCSRARVKMTSRRSCARRERLRQHALLPRGPGGRTGAASGCCFGCGRPAGLLAARPTRVYTSVARKGKDLFFVFFSKIKFALRLRSLARAPSSISSSFFLEPQSSARSGCQGARAWYSRPRRAAWARPRPGKKYAAHRPGNARRRWQVCCFLHMRIYII